MSAYDPSDPGAVFVDVVVNGFPAPFVFRAGKSVVAEDQRGDALLELEVKVSSWHVHRNIAILILQEPDLVIAET